MDAKLGDEKVLQKIESTSTDAITSKDYSGNNYTPFERVSRFPSPVSVPHSSFRHQAYSRDSSPGLSRQERLCLSDSEYSISLQSDGPRSPDLATPRSASDYSENSSVTSSLSPRSRTSPRVPSMLYSGEQNQPAPSSTELTHRTPLPTKKEPPSTRTPFEMKRAMDSHIHPPPTVRSLSPAESARGSVERSADLPADASLKRKSLDSQCVSSKSSYVESPQIRTLSIDGNYSRNRSPSATSSCDNIGTGASTHSGARSPSSIVLTADEQETPPRKRPTLGDGRIPGRATKGIASEPYTSFSAMPTVLSSELVVQSQDTGNKIAKHLDINTAKRGKLNDYISATDSSNQISMANNPKPDNSTIEPPGQLPPLDHTQRMIYPQPDQPQPHARTMPKNLLPNIALQHNHTLPPRPSISPPPGPSPQLSLTYRPPAVVFTIDNRAESRMPTADVQSFINQFTKNARVLIPPAHPSVSKCENPIGVIMWQSLPEFYKWYTETSGSTEIRSLKFELIDVQWQTEKVFVVPEGDLNYFRTLKQYIWDLFWVASNLNNGPSLFQVTVSPYPFRGATLLSQLSTRSSIKSTSPPPRISGPAGLENIMVVAEPQRVPVTSSSRPENPAPPLPTSTPKTSNIEHILNAKEVKEVKSRAGKRTTAPTNSQSAGKFSTNASSNTNRLPRPSEYIHGPPGPPVNTNRTSCDKSMLRDRAHALVSHPHSIYKLYKADNFEARWKKRHGTPQ